MKKIVILGASIHTGNLGVSALAHSIMGIISSINQDVEFYLLIPHRKKEENILVFNGNSYKVKTINYRLSPFSKPKENYIFLIFMSFLRKALFFKYLRNILDKNVPIFKLLKEADIVGDLWGGDSFSDMYGLFLYMKGVLIRNMVLDIRKDFIIFPQTFGPYRYRISKYFAKKIINKSSMVFSRGKEDIKIIEGFIAKKKNILFCPDVAFLLKSNTFNHLRNEDISFIENNNTIGINVSGLMLNNHGKYDLNIDYKELIMKAIKYFVIEKKVKVLLIPHTYSYPEPLSLDDDYLSCQTINNSFTSDIKKHIKCIYYQLSPEQIKWIIGKNSFFIGSRMHSTIASISQCIPTIGIGYSKKFIEVFSTAKVTNCVIDGRKQTTEKSLNSIKELYSQKENIKNILISSIPEVKELIQVSFKKIIT